MMFSKSLFVLLIGFAGVFCEDPKPQLRAAVHADIIKSYQPRINSLAQTITVQSTMVTTEITDSITLVKNEVVESVSNMKADINVANNIIVEYLKMSVVQASAAAKTCLSKLKITTTSLNVNNIQLCYQVDDYTSITQTRDQIVKLKTVVVGLPDTCRKQHLLDLDTNGITDCFDSNISYAEMELDTLVNEAETDIQIAESNAKTCITTAETEITSVTSVIPNQAEACKQL